MKALIGKKTKRQTETLDYSPIAGSFGLETQRIETEPIQDEQSLRINHRPWMSPNGGGSGGASGGGAAATSTPGSGQSRWGDIRTPLSGLRRPTLGKALRQQTPSRREATGTRESSRNLMAEYHSSMAGLDFVDNIRADFPSLHDTTLSKSSRIGAKQRSSNSGRGSSGNLIDASEGRSGSEASLTFSRSFGRADPTAFETPSSNRNALPEDFFSFDAFGNGSHGSLMDFPETPRTEATPKSVSEDDPSAPHSSISETHDSGRRESGRGEGRGEGRKSKMEKIKELLDLNKKLRQKNRSLEHELEYKNRKLKELQSLDPSGSGQASGEKSGDSAKHVEAIMALTAATKRQQETLNTQEEKYSRIKKELERSFRECRHLRKEVASKRTEIASLEKEVDAKMTETTNLRRDLAKAHQQVGMLEDEHDEDRVKIRKLTRELSQRLPGMQSAPNEIGDLEEKLEHAHEEIRKRDRLIESRRIEEESHQEQIMYFKSELERVQETLQLMGSKDDRLEELAGVNEELRFQLDQRTKELEEYQESSFETMADHVLSLKLAEEKIHELRDELMDSRQRLQEQEAQDERNARSSSEESHAEKERLEHGIIALQSALDASVAENELISSQNEIERRKFFNDLSKLKQELANSNMELEAARAKIESLASSSSRATGSKDEGDELSRQHSSEASESGQRSTKSENRQNAAETDRDIDSELRAYQREEERLKEANENLEGRVDDLLGEIKNWRTATEKAEEELSETRTALAALEEMVEDYDDMQEEAEQLRKQTSELMSQLEDASNERDELRIIAEHGKEDVAKLRSSLSQVDWLNQQVEKAKENNMELEANVKRLTESRDEWKETAESRLVQCNEGRDALVALEESERALVALGTDNQDLRAERNTLSAAIEQLQSERDQREQDIKRLEEEAADTKSALLTLAESNEELMTAKDDGDQYRAAVLELDTLVSQLTKERDELRGKLESDATGAKARIAGLEEAIRSHQMQHDSGSAALAETSGRLQKIQQECDKWKEVADKETSRAAEARAAQEALEGQLHEILKAHEQSTENGDSKGSDTSRTLQHLPKGGSEAVMELKSRLESVTRQRNELRSRMTDVETDLITSQMSLRNLDCDMDKLQREKMELARHNDALKSRVAESTSIAKEHEATSSKVQANLSEASSSLHALKEELATARRKNDELESLIKTMTRERDEWKESADRSQSKHKETESMVNSLREQIISLQQREESNAEGTRQLNDKMETEAKVLRTERDTLREALEKSEKDGEQTQLALTELEAEIQDYKSLLTDFEAKKQAIEELEANLEKAGRDIDDHKEKLRSAETRASDAEDALLSSSEQQERELTALQSEAEGLQVRNSEVMMQLAELEVQRDSLKREVDRVKASAADGQLLQSECQNLEDQLTTLKQEVESLEEENRNSQQALEELTKDRDQWKAFTEREQKAVLAARAELSSSSSKLSESLSASNKETESLHSEVSTLRSHNEKLETKVKDLETKRDELSRLQGESESEALSARDALKAAEKELEALADETALLCDQKEELEGKLSELGEARDALAAKEKESAEKLNEMQTKLSSLGGDHSALQQEHAKLQNTNTKVLADLEALRNDKEELADALEKVNLEVEQGAKVEEELRQRCQDLSDEVTSVRAVQRELNSERDGLVSERDSWMTKAKALESNKETDKDLQDDADVSVHSQTDVGTTAAKSVGGVSNASASLFALDEQSVVSSVTKRSSSRNIWSLGFSSKFIGGQEDEKADEQGDDKSVGAESNDQQAELERLRKLAKSSQETMNKLKTEMVQVKSNHDAEVKSTKRKIDSLEQENLAYELKIAVLEQELARLSDAQESDPSKKEETDPAKLERLEEKLDDLRQQKFEADEEIETLKIALESLQEEADTRDVKHEKEIEHMKALHDDCEQKVAAMEKVVLAINQENETLRSMAPSEVVDPSLVTEFQQNEKDVKIAQLHYELVNLRMQLDTIRHQDSKEKMVELEKEKLQMQASVEKQLSAFEEENNILLEDLRIRLRAREQTIRILEKKKGGTQDEDQAKPAEAG